MRILTLPWQSIDAPCIFAQLAVRADCALHDMNYILEYMRTVVCTCKRWCATLPQAWLAQTRGSLAAVTLVMLRGHTSDADAHL